MLQFNLQSLSRWNSTFYLFHSMSPFIYVYICPSTWRQHNVNSSEHVPHEQQQIFPYSRNICVPSLFYFIFTSLFFMPLPFYIILFIFFSPRCTMCVCKLNHIEIFYSSTSYFLKKYKLIFF
jgi:hypothetical protein